MYAEHTRNKGIIQEGKKVKWQGHEEHPETTAVLLWGKMLEFHAQVWKK